MAPQQCLNQLDLFWSVGSRLYGVSGSLFGGTPTWSSCSKLRWGSSIKPRIALVVISLFGATPPIRCRKKIAPGRTTSGWSGFHPSIGTPRTMAMHWIAHKASASAQFLSSYWEILWPLDSMFRWMWASGSAQNKRPTPGINCTWSINCKRKSQHPSLYYDKDDLLLLRWQFSWQRFYLAAGSQIWVGILRIIWLNLKIIS